MVKRKIIKIDEERCTGCGQCVSPCAEGALQIVNGKARVIGEELCDGAGFCLGVCPEDALSIEERETKEFSEEAVEEHVKDQQKTYIPQRCFRCDATEDEAVLFPCRYKGESRWACVKCLPPLIHG